MSSEERIRSPEPDYSDTWSDGCRACGGECYRDSVDVGVGIMRGPWGCADCGWSEDPAYDLTQPGAAEINERGGCVDQYGGYHPPGSIGAMARAAALRSEESDR